MNQVDINKINELIAEQAYCFGTSTSYLEYTIEIVDGYVQVDFKFGMYRKFKLNALDYNEGE